MIISYIILEMRKSGKLKKISQNKFDTLFKILLFAEMSVYIILFIIRFIKIVDK